MLEVVLLSGILVLVLAILVAVKLGFNEVIKGLQAIHDKLGDKPS